MILMTAFSSAELIALWEQAAGHDPVEQALILLSAAHPERPRSDLAAWTVGERDAGLLAMREALFGPSLRSLVECPACGARLEFVVPACDLRMDMAVPAGIAPLELCAGDVHLRFR